MTRRFIVELGQDAGFPNQSFSIKLKLNTLPGNPSVIAEKNSYGRQDSPPDNNRQESFGYEIKTSIIQSSSWQLLYATYLLVAFEPILTTKDAPLCATPYSWLLVEVVFAFNWLLKNYWNRDLLQFNRVEQPATYTTITAMFSPTHNPSQTQQSESSCQEPSKATTHSTDYFNRLLYSGSGNGNGDPKRHLHTMAFSCYVYPCHGVCKYSPSYGTTPEQSSCPHLTSEYCYSCVSHIKPVNATDIEQESLFERWNDHSYIQPLFDFDQLSEPDLHDIDVNPTETLDHELPMPGSLLSGIVNFANTNRPIYVNSFLEDVSIPIRLNHSETQQKTTESSQLNQNQPHLSETNALQLPPAIKDHTGQVACSVTVDEEGSRPRPCGVVCKNAIALRNHKSRCHTGQKTCHVTVVGQDGLKRPCGTVYKNAQSLSSHKRRAHNQQKKTCELGVIGKDGLPRPCGKVCKNAPSLAVHKSRYHTGQQICDAALVGEDGQQWTCGMICKNAQTLSDHRKRDHSVQKTCGTIVVEDNGLRHICGKTYKNPYALSAHKRKDHCEQKTCYVTVIGQDGLSRRCGLVCSNARTLSHHKRTHRKHNTFNISDDK
ncbi:C2H2-type zinc finger protein [Endozoicomonas sp. 8E]|uniref:C2H2-type zinc finger protein n=1 Tax=Endozoicomonas sp. 8E TaxID=3035692 RepID=UPI0029394198|nr:C2H2-type zinc finger protein [Endozoicomonas sp. 8E]WOG26920.1 C2H2-type zinc finger protein [Endozoicomonas sp. 8E]